MNLAMMSTWMVLLIATVTTAGATFRTDAPWWLSAAITGVGSGIGYVLAVGCLNVGYWLLLKNRKGASQVLAFAGYMAVPFVFPLMTGLVCVIGAEALLTGLGYSLKE